MWVREEVRGRYLREGKVGIGVGGCVWFGWLVGG